MVSLPASLVRNDSGNSADNSNSWGGMFNDDVEELYKKPGAMVSLGDKVRVITWP